MIPDLNTIWFYLLGILLTGYAVLDGFDFGVGVLHLFARTETERKVDIHAIGPVWDGNEVWLLTFGGALFAAFPPVYATVFSGFYLALVLLLASLIFRAVSIEFRGKIESSNWKRFWDWSFGVGSLLPAVLFGVAVGNILRGIPISADGVFTGNFASLLNPFSLLVGALSLSMCTMHGAIYLMMKTENDYRDRLEKIIPGLWIAFVLLYLLTTAVSIFVCPVQFFNAVGRPVSWIALLIFILALGAIPFLLKSGRDGTLFFVSSVTIAGLIGLLGASLYPRLVPSLTRHRVQSDSL